jgi:acetolactate synthase I/II/III large subunit
VPGGGANLDLVEACERAGLRFVLTHGETAGAIMAAVYGELTGRPGACVATRGPGAAALATGVAHGWLDRCPMLAVVDAVPAAQSERISHQRLDQSRLLGAAAKAFVRLGDGSGAWRAVACAATPPWGPVVVETDATAAGVAPDCGPPAATGPRELSAAAALLAGAVRPLALVGVGARGATDAVRELVAATGMPVLTTYKAKGAVPEASLQAAGLLTGATIEAPLLEAADAVLAIGVDPVELIPAEWPYAAPVVSAGPWPVAEPYLPVAVELVGDVAELLAALAPSIRAHGWARAGQEYRRDALARLADPGGGLTPHAVVDAAREAFGPHALATVDSGAHMLVAMARWEASEPGQVLISSGLATMGFALPAAIAAALVRPDRRVVCLTGDGGLGMCLAELETLARLALPVTVVVFDDAALSLIAVKQRPGGHGGPGAVTYRDVDFAAVAAGLGVPAERVTTPVALAAALAGAAAAEGPRLIDAVLDPSGYGDVLAAIRGRKKMGGGGLEPPTSCL